MLQVTDRKRPQNDAKKKGTLNAAELCWSGVGCHNHSGQPKLKFLFAFYPSKTVQREMYSSQQASNAANDSSSTADQNAQPPASKWFRDEQDDSSTDQVGLVPHNRGYKHILFS